LNAGVAGSAASVRLDGVVKVYIKRRSLRDIALLPFRPGVRTRALAGVSLEVAAGEVFGILGPNGAGKTTLLKILAGLVVPTEGTAIVGGLDVRHHDRAVRRLIGFASSDERSFYWRLGGRENLEFFARLYGLHGAAAARRVASLIDDLDLGGDAARPFMDLSSGMKQRFIIARALLHDPPIVCLDEPTRSLDPIAAKHVRALVSAGLRGRSGKTILLATHNLQEAEQICDRVAVLDRGRVLRQGRVAEITAGLPGRDHYLLDVEGLGDPPRDARWTIAVERAGGRVRLVVDVDRNGALSDLLRVLLAGGARVLSCSRREPSLQEIFDLIEPGGKP
jgi:ABC-2 type transport system ATP-binding protein